MTIGVSDGTQFPDQFSYAASYHDGIAEDQHDQDVHQALIGLGYPDDQDNKPVKLAMSDLPGHPPLSLDPLGQALERASTAVTGHEIGGAAPIKVSPKEPIKLKEAEPEGGYNSKVLNYTVHQGEEQLGNLQFRIHDDQPNIAKLEWAGRDVMGGPADKDSAANTLGASVVRQAFKAFIEQHPEINRIYAERISGARAKSDPEGIGDTVGFKVDNGRLKLINDYKYFQPEENPSFMPTFNTYDPQIRQQMLMPPANQNIQPPEAANTNIKYQYDPSLSKGSNAALEKIQQQYGLSNEDFANMVSSVKNNIDMQKYNKAVEEQHQKSKSGVKRSLYDPSIPEINPVSTEATLNSFNNQQGYISEATRLQAQEIWNKMKSLKATKDKPQEIGLLGESIGGPLSMASQMGAHADWDKFAKEQRPSTNIEDDRNRQKTPGEILQDLNPINAIPNGLSNIMYK